MGSDRIWVSSAGDPSVRNTENRNGMSLDTQKARDGMTEATSELKKVGRITKTAKGWHGMAWSRWQNDKTCGIGIMNVQEDALPAPEV